MCGLGRFEFARASGGRRVGHIGLIRRHRQDFERDAAEQILQQDRHVGRVAVEMQAVPIVGVVGRHVTLHEGRAVGRRDPQVGLQRLRDAARDLQAAARHQTDGHVRLVGRDHADGAMAAEFGGHQLVAGAGGSRCVPLEAEIAHVKNSLS